MRIDIVTAHPDLVAGPLQHSIVQRAQRKGLVEIVVHDLRPYGEGKPTCAKCPIHCYKRVQREQAREIMRYAGPRMTYRHPWLALTHLLDKLRKVEHPMEARRKQRSQDS